MLSVYGIQIPWFLKAVSWLLLCQLTVPQNHFSGTLSHLKPQGCGNLAQEAVEGGQHEVHVGAQRALPRAPIRPRELPKRVASLAQVQCWLVVRL